MSQTTSRVAPAFCAVLCVLALCLSRVDARAGEAPSNLELMTTLTTEAVTELMTRVEHTTGGRGVRLKPGANSEEYRFIANIITTVLSERGVTVHQTVAANQAATPDDALDLQFQALEFSVTYPKVFRSYLVGGKHVRRRADVALLVTVVDPTDGTVLRTDQASRNSEDEFGYGEMGGVERGTFAFVRPEVPSSGWTRAVEPVFVSGIIVGLIYLLFSNQSDN